MSFFRRLSNFFSRAGRAENLMKEAMAHASADRPDQAIAIYDTLINSRSASATVRSRALFNRALAHSAQKNEAQAVADLEEASKMDGAPENVVAAARNQLIRIHNRTRMKDQKNALKQNAPPRG